MRIKIFFIFILCMLFISFQVLDKNYFKVPKNWPKPNYNFKLNPLSKEKILLGRALFYDPILSANNTISCATCHSPYNAFAHVDHALSHGLNDSIGNRNAPALVNLAWQKSFMWDGAINHLDMQALAPISNKIEMGERIENVVYKLQHSYLYPRLFWAAFRDSNITGEYTLKAISQFMLTLVSANSKYDSVLRKQTTFTNQEKNGYSLFKKNCAACHTEPLFTNLQFENNGLPVDKTLNDFGRIRISKNPNDSLKFKVPSLRNIEYSYPYMHDGRFKTLSTVIKHYTNGVERSKTLSTHLKNPIVLTSNEKVDLVAFLLTLSDRQFLFNQAFSYPKNIFYPKAKE